MRAQTTLRHLLFVAAILLTAVSAFAISLEQAKIQGLVGETRNGYLGVVALADPEVARLVEEINAKRRERYKQIAANNGTPVAAVEALAGEKAIAQTPPGQYIQSPSGVWQKK